MEADEPPRCRGGARRMTLPEGQRLVITGVSLVEASAVAQPLVNVWAEVGHEARAIVTLSPENPIARLQPVMELGVGDGEFVLRHDSSCSSVRLYGCYFDPPDPEREGEPTTTTCSRFVQDIYAGEVPDGEEEEEQEVWVDEYEPLSEEAMAERYDSDNGEDDDDDEEEDRHPPGKAGDGEAAGESSQSTSSSKRTSVALIDAPAGLVVPDGAFLGPARFAAVKNTAGVMRIAAADAGTATGSQREGKEILVRYRYARFSRPWSGRRGVEACRRTKLHWLRFAVPAAGDTESSLAWAASSLGPLVYPALFRRELRDLWSSLAAAPAINDTIPPSATRIQVVVDAGILRREDCTAERMEHMRGALEAMVGEAWPERYHVGMDLHLPEPVRVAVRRRREEDGDEDGARPAKRRRVVVAGEGEECSLCLDPMEAGLLAAWPGCRHVFHGECVEQTLAGRPTCPLCRHHLSDALIGG